MNSSRHGMRILCAAVALLGLATGRTAAAASADLKITAEVVVHDPLELVSNDFFAGGLTYGLTIKNLGPDAAGDVVIDATLPTGLVWNKVTPGLCTPVTAGTVFPCSVGAMNASATAGILLEVMAKPTLCQDLADTTFTVADEATTPSTDPVAGNDSADVVNPTALHHGDVQVTLTGPDTASEGDTLTFTGTVKNAGPCDLEDVILDQWVMASKVLTFTGTDLPCAGWTGTTTAAEKWTDLSDPVNGAQCDLGAMTANQTISFTETMSVGTVADGLIQISVPNGIEQDGLGPDDDDYNRDTDVALTDTVVKGNNAGCNALGGAGPLAALAMSLLFALRRRRA